MALVMAARENVNEGHLYHGGEGSSSTSAVARWRRWESIEILQEPDRPWLDLYGTFLRTTSSWTSAPSTDTAPIHHSLPDELLHEVFARASPYTLGRAMCVCRRWRYAIRHSSVLWRSACLKAWPLCNHEEHSRILFTQYGGSWLRMFRHRPRVRTDGIYVARNTYIKTGVMEWDNRSPVHLVIYYRYLRFTPGGRFLYKVTPQRLSVVAKAMSGLRAQAADDVLGGKCTLTGDQVEAAVLYPTGKPTVLRIRLRVRGTQVGSWNRLDVLALVTTGLREEAVLENDDVLSLTESWDLAYTARPDVPAVSHSRGTAPFVFVPFEEVETSVLNLPVDKMDYFVPG